MKRGEGYCESARKGEANAAVILKAAINGGAKVGSKQMCLTLQGEADTNWEAVDELEEKAKAVIWGWLLDLAWRGYGKVRVTSARRTLDVQRRLFGMGRTAEECRVAGVPQNYANADADQVTWTKPEESLHVLGKAVDVDVSSYTQRDVLKIRDCARRHGLTVGADWHVRDMNHYELREAA